MTDSLIRVSRGDFASDGKQILRKRIGLALLIFFYIVICCVSLRFGFPHYRESYILYDQARLYYAISTVAAFASVSSLFIFARFSFGYFTGFYLYTMILGYLWLNCFSQFNYNHKMAGVSAAVSPL